MAPNWTSEQKKVIDLHDRNILVSAAAGSGKTAVLVQRIVEMISDKSKPMDIDKLVIVTFTNAAAYEMRQRIMDAIEARMVIEPENAHLRRQHTLINHAQITTIDSFCLNILRNYFSEIDLDPGFKVADEGELKLMMSDVMDEMIEDYYSDGRAEFLDFVECFTPEKTDARLGEYILNLYKASQSNPWPKEWLLKCRQDYNFENLDDFEKSEIIRYVSMEVRKQVDSAYDNVLELQAVSSQTGGPYMYNDALNDDLMLAERLKNARNHFDVAKIISEHKWARLSSKKDADVEDDLREYVKSARDVMKKALTKIKEDYFNQDLTSSYKQILACFSHIDIYVEMTIDFMERFDERKRRKNIINFSDMEHLALNILVKKNKDELEYTSVADELAGIYEEILIDEYQDSNLVQELILNSISRERFGKPNVFMVGDVKQSIYRFRLARPELFIEKYDKYSEEDSLYQKIELHNNFRSRETVLSSVNQVFERIMQKSFGNIAYDDNAKLYAGAKFPEGGSAPEKTTVLLLESGNISGDGELEAEAVLCANEIRKIVNNPEYLCLDKESGGYRKIRYSDITILMRSAKQNADTYINILANAGIPAVAQSDSGYFDSFEIIILLNLLMCLDNPRQDIPLVSVLKSYFGGFTNDELAIIRSANKDVTFYEAFMKSESEKKTRFLTFVEKLRDEAEHTKIHELIWNIVYDTGYYAYVGSMPLGKERQANIDMLIEKAKAYENTSFCGLFNFVRYIERLKSYDVDYGGASLNSENDDVVRIMTIHKSKGLEFPVVFLANAHKGFNNMDANQKIIIDSDLGIGIDMLDSKNRIRQNTVTKRAISMKIRLANLNEEQRILYVAMTRAKEMLYVTGCVKNMEKAVAGWSVGAERRRFSYSDFMAQKSYLDMIMPSALREWSHFRFLAVGEEAFLRMRQSIFVGLPKYEDIEKAEFVQPEAEFVYPYKIVDMPVKVTVSELKHRGQDFDEEFSSKLIDDEMPSTIPKFIAGEAEVVGAARGSAYHKLMELIDFEKCVDSESVRDFVEQCVTANKMPREWADAIDVNDIVHLLESDFGMGLKIAFENKRLYREKQFVMGIPANEVDEIYDESEMVLVQGIIDVFYETDEGIVLADYKTDSVLAGNAGCSQLIDRYKGQLDYYAKAISNLTGKKVIKKIIYSFKLGKSIYLQ